MQQPQCYKIIMLGDPHIGKRSLLNKAFDIPQRLSSLYLPVEFVEVNGRSNEGPFKMHFYDSLIRNSMISKPEDKLGEQFCAQVIPGAHVVLLCYACNDSLSLWHLLEWISMVKKFITSKTLVYLVGTKCDRPSRFDENVYETVRASLDNVYGGFKTSSKNGTNVENLFAHLLNSFNKLPSVISKREFSLNMLPSRSLSHLDRRDNSLSISITTPRGTITSYKKGIPNEAVSSASLHEMVSPSKDLLAPEMAKNNKTPISEKDTTIYSGRTGIREMNFSQPQMSYSQGRVTIKNFTPQEVRAGRPFDSKDTSLVNGLNTESHFKCSVYSLNQLHSKNASKQLNEDFTELEDYEDEPKQIRSKCRYILEDDSIILDVKSTNEEGVFSTAQKHNSKEDLSYEEKEKNPEKKTSKFGDKHPREGYVLNVWF